MALGIDPTVDYAFKRIFGDPRHSAVLIHLLNAIFEGQFQVEGVEILTPILDKDFDDDKESVLDLHVRDTRGRVYNLEMQTTVPAGLANRLTYYLASLYAGQLREGDPYHELAPTISVCFLGKSLLGPTSSFHTRFRFCSLEERVVFTDQMEVHLVELPKYNGTKNDMPTARAKERWAYFLSHASEMTLGEIGQVLVEPAFVEAGGVLEMISLTDEERLRYALRAKAIRDRLSDRDAARMEGRTEGIEIGIEKGIEKGRLFERIRMLQELLGEPVSPLEYLDRLSLDQLEQTAKELESRWRSRA